MRILWITNIVFPEARQLLSGHNSFTASGGWMLGAAKALLEHNDIELSIATPSSLVSDLKELYGRNTRFFLFPLGKGNLKRNDEYREYWREIHDRIRPNVVHIHGTEFSHGLAYVDECGSRNVVVSIQGLTSEIAKYYSLGLSKWLVLQHTTIGDLFRGNVFSEVRRYRDRGKVEIELINKVHNIIGRTSFDRAHVCTINPNVKYHFCNEILREEFYTGKWQYDSCDPHTIFFSQANNPLKGLHFMLEAITLVKRVYPDIKLLIAGRDITKHASTLKGLYAFSGYGKLIKREIIKHNLEENICFLGPLTAQQIKDELLRANMFVCASTIENSSNSLAEAQILGVPCVASYVGGLPDMIPSAECGRLYRCDDVVALASHICDIFETSPGFDNTFMRDMAIQRHSHTNNTYQLMSIYKQLS